MEEKIKNIFRGEIIGRELVFFQSAASTNDEALRLIQAKDNPEGIVIFADSQERGRGRFNRSWVSPPDVNLYFTVVLKPPLHSKDAALLTLMAAVAAVSAIREYTGLDAGIKWPNDILIRDKKAGGILAETKTNANGIIFAAVGIGLNVNLFMEMLPEEIRALATSLIKEKGEPVDRIKLLSHILSRMEHWYKVLLNDGKKILIDECVKLSSTVGNMVDIIAPDGVKSGIAEGISEDGALVLKSASGSVEMIYAGDVTVLKDTS
ncbi:MAG: biotin--[acetyl-CoA-carboxylase] ligase [Nitrospirae bacterium]|nr:biotin--[acetyl-CoA-carboxylase] ligase [Nitrospirota bacterium]